MNKLKIFIFAAFFQLLSAQSDNTVFAFFEYDIKSGMTDQFIAGYAKDLEWHKSQNDDWDWIGWFVLNGNRRGRFIDATPNHYWPDFDQWKVNSTENNRHNKIHWLNYVENPSGSYKRLLKEYSDFDANWITSKFLQVYKVTVKPGKSSTFEGFLKLFQLELKRVLSNHSFIWMKIVSGGKTEQYELIIAFDKLASFKALESIFLFSKTNTSLVNQYTSSVLENTSELWGYSPSLTLKH